MVGVVGGAVWHRLRCGDGVRVAGHRIQNGSDRSVTKREKVISREAVQSAAAGRFYLIANGSEEAQRRRSEGARERRGQRVGGTIRRAQRAHRGREKEKTEDNGKLLSVFLIMNSLCRPASGSPCMP